ncbi:MAG: hypothetical protein FGM24_04925 [Candidatus Kapabacteria bacterium]|nr:hypothetical protein [Candidatus Kapabacteria bacterium]
MTPSTRSKAIELHQHNPTQVLLFWTLSIVGVATLFLYVATPVMQSFFGTFLQSKVLMSGERVVYRLSESRPDDTLTTDPTTLWALAEPARKASTSKIVRLPRAEYVFQPVIALGPLVAVGGLVVASLLTALLPAGVGFIRQKIEREILNALDRLAWAQYGEHTADEIKRLVKDITVADIRRLHDLADIYGVRFTDLELLRNAVRWREGTGIQKLLRVHDGIKFYMREYFTDRYANAVLGFVYIGAAVLIIVIGLRGLKFIPGSDPSIVLGALGLEFTLLITYAVVLMYGRVEEGGDAHRPAAAELQGGDERDADTEQLLRAFLATPRSNTQGDNS